MVSNKQTHTHTHTHLEGAHVFHCSDVVELDRLIAGARDQPVPVLVPRHLMTRNRATTKRGPKCYQHPNQGAAAQNKCPICLRRGGKELQPSQRPYNSVSDYHAGKYIDIAFTCFSIKSSVSQRIFSIVPDGLPPPFFLF